MRVGAIVRVALHGRRVRGWVVADDVESEVDVEHAAAGPRRRVGRAAGTGRRAHGVGRAPLLRLARRAAAQRVAAEPRRARHRRGAPDSPAVPDAWPDAGSDTERDALALAAGVRDAPVAALRWPPLARPPAARRAVAGAATDRVSSSSPTRRVDGRSSTGCGAPGRAPCSCTPTCPTRSAPARGRRAAAGRVVVVGGRIAAFAPVPDLQCAIVVDDSDAALQEERTPTWHARELLAERARRAGARFAVVLGGAERRGRGARGRGARAAAARSKPRVGRGSRSSTGARSLPASGCSPNGWRGRCATRATPALRRSACSIGGAGSACSRARPAGASCAGTATARRCGTSPADAPAAIGSVPAPRPDVCPHCGGTRLRVLRSGITRVREELAALLPGATRGRGRRRHRPRSPTSDGRRARRHRGGAAAGGGPPAASGRSSRSSTSTRSCSRRGRAPRSRRCGWSCGRPGSSPGTIVRRPACCCRPRLPDHEVVRAAVTGDPALVAEAERARRRALGFPPFGGLAEISGAIAAVDAAAATLRRAIRAVTVLGPDRKGETARPLRAGDADPDAVADRASPAGRSTRGLAPLGRLHVAVDPATRI